MLVTLREWDETTFSRPHSITTLRTWARTGQIYPTPTLVGREYMVDENAQYVPLRQNPNVPKLIEDPIVSQIFHGAKTA